MTSNDKIDSLEIQLSDTDEDILLSDTEENEIQLSDTEKDEIQLSDKEETHLSDTEKDEIQLSDTKGRARAGGSTRVQRRRGSHSSQNSEPSSLLITQSFQHHHLHQLFLQFLK